MSSQVDGGQGSKLRQILPELQLQNLKTRIIDHLRGEDALDQTEIRKMLKMKSSDDWREILHELLEEPIIQDVSFGKEAIKHGCSSVGWMFIQDLLSAEIFS